MSTSVQASPTETTSRRNAPPNDITTPTPRRLLKGDEISPILVSHAYQTRADRGVWRDVAPDSVSPRPAPRPAVRSVRTHPRRRSLTSRQPPPYAASHHAV